MPNLVFRTATSSSNSREKAWEAREMSSPAACTFPSLGEVRFSLLAFRVWEYSRAAATRRACCAATFAGGRSASSVTTISSSSAVCPSVTPSM